MKLKFKSVELVEENGQFYLDAVYLHELRGSVSEVHFPRIEIPFARTDEVSLHQCTRSTSILPDAVDIDVGKGTLFLAPTKDPDGNDCFYYMQTLEREMTVDEIEKNLGYRVKIVGGTATDDAK